MRCPALPFRTAWWALALALAAAVSAVAGDRFALVVGVSKCKALGELPLCATDALMVADVLAKRAGYGQVVVLSDAQPDLDLVPTLGRAWGRAPPARRAVLPAHPTTGSHARDPAGSCAG